MLQEKNKLIKCDKKDLQASTLVGLAQENPVLDPLAVPHLNNKLKIKLSPKRIRLFPNITLLITINFK